MNRPITRRGALALGTAAGLAALVRQAGAQSPPPGLFRFVNAVPNSLSQSIVVNGQPVLGPIAYGGVSSWLPLINGQLQVEVVPVPLQGGSPMPPLFTTTVTMQPETWVTLLAIGQQVADNVQPWVITDQAPSAAAGGALVRVIHAAVGGPPLHVVASGPITTQFGDVRYNEASAYVGMEAASYQFSAVSVPPAAPLPTPPVFAFGTQLPNPLVTGQRPANNPIPLGYSSYSVIVFGRVAMDPYLACLVTTDLASI